MSAPAGWFPDPGGAIGTYRWWDGRGWSRWLSDDVAAGPPAAAPAPLVALAPPPAPVGAPGPAASAVPAPAPAQAVRTPPSGSAAPVDTHAVSVPIAVALVVGVVVVALLVVGLTVVLTEDRIRTGPAAAPPSAPPPAGLLYNVGTRQVRADTVSVVLPGEPYLCETQPGPLKPVLSSGLTCDAAVHRDFAGQRDWYATSGFGLVESDLVDPDSPTRTAESLFAALRREFFTDTATRVQNLAPVRNEDIPVGKGVFLAGDVHYSVPGLSSRYDRLVVGIFPLPDGRQAAFFSSRPDDTPAATLDAVNRSIATLAAR